MAITAHIETLNERHNQLEVAIAEEAKRPAYDDVKVLELKRQKLKIKDEIEEIRSRLGTH